MLEALITSKTRLRLLLKFFVSATNQGYLRGIAEEFDESTNAIRRELNQLSDAGYLQKKQEGNRVLYSANILHPLFQPLQNLIHSYMGWDEAVENVLEKSGNVRQVVLVGDYAIGKDSGTIEAYIVGDNLNVDYISKLREKVSHKLGKEIKINTIGTAVDVLPRIVLYEKQ